MRCVSAGRESLAAAEAGKETATARQAVTTPISRDTRTRSPYTPGARPGSLAYQLLPRATVTASPLTPDAASPHRNTITSATSRGVRTRPGGYEAARSVHT